MRSEIVEESFEKVWSYAKGFNLLEALKVKELHDTSFLVYKKSFPLLIWRNELKKYRIAEDYLYYFEESVSDVSTAFFLFVQGFYKPSYFALRSAIENYLKFFYFVDFNAQEAKRIDIVISELKGKYFPTERIIHASFVSLSNSYSELSLCVHGASEYMAMMQGLSDYPKFSSEHAKIFQKHIDIVCPSINFLSVYKFEKQYYKIHFKHRDIITSQLAKKHKKMLFTNTA